MCQGLLCCRTAYFNCCSSWMGCSVALLCCNCWLCPNVPISHMRSRGCIKCTTESGCGCSALCTSFYCCIPGYVEDYSIWSTLQ